MTKTSFDYLLSMVLKNSSKGLMVGVMLFSLFALSGCFNFGASTTTPKVTTDERYRTINDTKYDFTVTIPREWDVIEAKDFTSDVPEQTVIVFRNNVKNEDFTANVNIIKNPLQNPRETLEYAKMVLNRQKTGLYNYKETKDRETSKIQIGDQKVDTYITFFEAKKDPASALTRFIQTYGVKANSAYVVTAAISPQENANNIKTVEDIIRSFKLK